MISAVLKLKDEYTSTANKIINKAKQLDSELSNSSKAYNKLSSVTKRVMSSIHNSFSRVLNLVTKPITFVAKSKVGQVVSKITTKIAKLTAKPFTVTLKGAGLLAKGGMKAFNFVKGGLATVSKLGITAAAAVGAGLVGSMKMGSELEQQKISMNHFLGGDAEKSNNYLNELRNNANLTPFETGEVVSAGTRAIQIAEGDTSKGMQLVKMAEDMAALNPDKTLGQAMEALADAQMGELERLKEFGFKGSKENFDKAGGDITKMKSLSGKTLNQMYQGGAEKFAMSSKGKLSTIIGNVKTGIQDAGLKLLDRVSPLLDKLIPLANAFREKLTNVTDVALNYFEDFFKGFSGIGDQLMPIFESFATNLTPIFNDIINGIGPALKGAFELLKPVLEQLGPLFSKVWEALGVLVQPLSDLASALMPIISEAMGFLGRILQEIVMPAFRIIGSFISQMLVPAYKILWDIISTVLTPVIDLLSIAFKCLEPVIQKVIGVIGEFFKAISSVVEKIKGIVGGITGGIKKGFDWLANKITGHATGTESFAGGFTRINERGEEIVNLPNGTKIYPSGKTNQIMNKEFGNNSNSNNENSNFIFNININTGGIIDENKLGQIIYNQFKKSKPQIA